MFVGYKPMIPIPELVKQIKIEANLFIKGKKWIPQRLWQEGYGAFSYLQSHFSRVIDYIDNQERHHANTSFKTEYLQLLRKFDIHFEDKYVFEFLE